MPYLYDWLRVLRLVASDLAVSAPVVAAEAALSLTSLAFSFASAATFLAAGAGEEPRPRTPKRTATTVTKMAARPPAISGTNLIASMGSFLAIVRKRSSFSVMYVLGSSRNLRSLGDLGFSSSLGLSADSSTSSIECFLKKVSSASLRASSTEWPM